MHGPFALSLSLYRYVLCVARDDISVMQMEMRIMSNLLDV